jgi:uncharacterized protein involved in tolerance to divalent cations
MAPSRYLWGVRALPEENPLEIGILGDANPRGSRLKWGMAKTHLKNERPPKKKKTDLEPLYLGMISHPHRKGLQHLIQQALAQRLIACGSVFSGKVSSWYRWKSKTHHASEVVAWIKVPKSRVTPCIRFLSEHHPYECPEILLIRVDHAFAPYHLWAIQSCLEG